MAIFKTYRYRIHLGKEKEFMQIQREADAIYSKHFKYDIMHLQSATDRAEWMEIHRYNSEEDIAKAETLHEREKGLTELFQRFVKCLAGDPDQPIAEMKFIDKSIR